MLDPVFVDTSEGRAVVADSLKSQVEKELEKVGNEKLMNVETEIKNKPKGKIKTEEVDDGSQSSGNVTQEDEEVEVRRGKWNENKPNENCIVCEL